MKHGNFHSQLAYIEPAVYRKLHQRLAEVHMNTSIALANIKLTKLHLSRSPYPHRPLPHLH